MKTIYGVQTLTLPSGSKVRVRRPSVLSLIASGGFPGDLTSEAWKIARKDMIDPDKMAADPEGIRTWARLIDAYIPFVPVDLTIAPAKSDVDDSTAREVGGFLTGVVKVTSLSDMDKQVLFLFGTDVLPSDEEMAAGKKELISAAALKEFRDGGEGADAGHGGEEIRAEAVDVPGDRAVVAAGA